MVTSSISNRTQRTNAILRVAGLYLVTVIILALIFWRNGRVSADETNKLVLEKQELVKELDDLKQSIGIQDSLREITKELLNLYVKNPGDASSEMKSLEAAFNDNSLELSVIQRNSNKILSKEIEAISDTRDLFVEMRDLLQEQLELQNESLVDCGDRTEQCEESVEDLNDQIGDLNQEIKLLKGDLRIKTQEVQLKDQALLAIQGGSASSQQLVIEAETKVATLKGEVGVVNSSLGEVRGEMQEILRSQGWPTKTRKSLRMWADKIVLIEDDLKDLAR